MINQEETLYNLNKLYNYDLKLITSWISTPLGYMLAIANKDSLLFLDFADTKDIINNQKLLDQRLIYEIESLIKLSESGIKFGQNYLIDSISHELKEYFLGNLKAFKTPIYFFGTSFQKNVWDHLRKIPFGKTCSYSELASSIGNPKACRAVGHANSLNRLSITVPCHRVISINKGLGGYAGGIGRKKWLLDHENSILKNKS